MSIWVLSIFCYYKPYSSNSLVHMSFHILPVYLWDRCLEMSFLGQRVNAYVVVRDIDKYPSMGVVSFCITMSNT